MKDDEEGSGLGVSMIFFFDVYVMLCARNGSENVLRGVSVGIWIVYCVSSTIYVSDVYYDNEHWF